MLVTLLFYVKTCLFFLNEKWECQRCFMWLFVEQIKSFFFLGLLLNCNWSIVSDITLYIVIPTRRSIASATQILISHALGDAISPYLIGVVADWIRPTLNPFHPVDPTLLGSTNSTTNLAHHHYEVIKFVQITFNWNKSFFIIAIFCQNIFSSLFYLNYKTRKDT